MDFTKVTFFIASLQSYKLYCQTDARISGQYKQDFFFMFKMGSKSHVICKYNTLWIRHCRLLVLSHNYFVLCSLSHDSLHTENIGFFRSLFCISVIIYSCHSWSLQCLTDFNVSLRHHPLVSLNLEKIVWCDLACKPFAWLTVLSLVNKKYFAGIYIKDGCLREEILQRYIAD